MNDKNDINMTNEITTIKSTMSSLQIAELTGKRHANVMRDIANLLEQGVAQLNFELGSYSDANGQLRPCYQLTKTGCLILASGYNAVLREKIINRWVELETASSKQCQVPASYSEALMLVARQAEQLERAQKQIAQQAGAIGFFIVAMLGFVLFLACSSESPFNRH